jgi:asparagine synthase (glutamine-hydrolysing)
VDREAFFSEYYKAWQRLVPDEDKAGFFSDSAWKGVRDRDTSETLKRVFTFNDSLRYETPEDHIANSLYFEAKTFLHGLFIVQDKLSMASGLEERVPFLDNDLVDFAQKIPIHHKLRNLKEMKTMDEDELRKTDLYFQQTGDGKNCLRKAMAELLPASVINRPKQGFSAPDESWYRGAGIPYVRKILDDPKSCYREFIQPKTVERILTEHCDRGINHRLLIWSLLCFEWWCRIFIKGEPIP